MTATHEHHPGTGHGHHPIDADELGRLLRDPDVTIVDVRPSAAYNGWHLNGERRGGHIPGAVSFPHAWIDRLDEAEAARLLDAKGVLGHRTVVVYGHDAWDAWTFALKVEGWGHAVRIYEAGWAEWGDDDRLPVARLPNYHRLIHPEWLRELIDGGRPEAYEGHRFGVFHVNFGVPEEYADGHLPGAMYLDTNRLEDSADWNRRSPDELESTLRAFGITHDTTVVLYGRDTAGGANEKWPGRRAGQIAATRAAAILHYAGVDDIRVLDGGFDAWVTRGHPLETADRQPIAVAGFGVSIPQRPETIIDIGDAKAILADPEGAALVSVRAWREHIGAVSGYNYIGPAGRIAGDVWGNCGSDAYHMQHYRSVDNTMRSYPEIAANWAAAGITPDKWVAFYCGTGWRASETWFYAHLMGWERIAVYDGGWLEWSADPVNNPIETGEPEEEFAA